MNNYKKFVKKFVIYLILMVAAVVVLFPFYWMFRTAIIDFNLLYKYPIVYFTDRIQFNSFIYLFQKQTIFIRWFANSAIVSVLTVLITVFVGSLAAYSLSRFSFRMKNPLQMFILSTNMIPKIAVIIPYYLLLLSLHWTDTYQGLILAYVAMVLPFTCIMLTAHFSGIPRDLDDAAMVDGCTRIGALFRVILPVAASGIAATSAFAFVVTWTEYLFAQVITSSNYMQTLPVGLVSFFDAVGYAENYSVLNAGAVITVIPAIILFIFLQKYLIKEIGSGAVKM